uniref:Uncharacterized protein n=1 Tax=Peronospora matthiolae TaxID=2874970 RepID=A0AAV1UUE0_9STRA
MEKFKALDLAKKKPMDASDFSKWVEFNAFHGYTHPDASEIAILVKHKTPKEVVETLTTLRREHYLWRYWSRDLHRAIASYYLEQNTPEVILTAWLDLDLKPRDLYDDLGFSKEAGGVRDSPEAALMFYKYAELHREEGRDYALSADETAAHMFRNLTPEEATAFLKKAKELKVPEEFAKVVHELQLTSKWIEKFRENLPDVKKMSEEEFVRLGLTEEGPVDVSKLDQWILFNEFHGYTHPYRNPDALQVAILMKHKTAEEVVKALTTLRREDYLWRIWSRDLHRAIASYYLDKGTPEVMLNAWDTLKLKPEDVQNSLDSNQHFSERESTDAAWVIYKYTELLLKQNSGYQSRANEMAERIFRHRAPEEVSGFLEKAATLTESEEFVNLVHKLQPILQRIDQNRATMARSNFNSEMKLESLGLNNEGPVNAHACRMWVDSNRYAHRPIQYSSQAVILLKHKTPEEVVGALILKEEDDLHEAIAIYYLEKDTPEVMLNAWLTLELKPKKLYHSLAFSKLIEGVHNSPGAALMFYKYTELLREKGKAYALSAEQTAELMFSSLLPDNAIAFLHKASELAGAGEMDKIKFELQPILRQIEKFRFIRQGLKGKEPVDDKSYTELKTDWAYAKCTKHSNYFRDPSKLDVERLMENKTPEEVVEALTSIQKNTYWRRWASDLHGEVASHFLEKKTPKALLNAWFTLALEPKDLYDIALISVRSSNRTQLR